ARGQHMQTGERTLPPFGFTVFCLHNPEPCRPSPPQRLYVTAELRHELAQVNVKVNGSIVPFSDYSAVREWRDHTNIGDCKDYALTKRSQLTDRGYPASALVLATAWLPNGEHHAVLVVLTNQGDLVLDNLRSAPVGYQHLPYRWDAIMSPENPQFW